MIKSEETKIQNVRKAELNKIGYLDLENWLLEPNHVYVGRNLSFYVKGAIKSKWCNPYKVSKNIDLNTCLIMYEKHLIELLKNEQNLAEFLLLKGKILGCWCYPEPCHADIIIKKLIELS